MKKQNLILNKIRKKQKNVNELKGKKIKQKKYDDDKSSRTNKAK